MKLPNWGPLGWLIAAFLVFFVVTAPDSAAAIIEKGFGLIGVVAQGVSEFITDVAL